MVCQFSSWIANSERDLGVQEIYVEVTPVKGKGRKKDWSAGAVRPQCRLAKISASPMGAPEHTLPFRGVSHWVEMARSCYHHLSQSLTGGHTEKIVISALMLHWILNELAEGSCQLTILLAHFLEGRSEWHISTYSRHGEIPWFYSKWKREITYLYV